MVQGEAVRFGGGYHQFPTYALVGHICASCASDPQATETLCCVISSLNGPSNSNSFLSPGKDLKPRTSCPFSALKEHDSPISCSTRNALSPLFIRITVIFCGDTRVLQRLREGRINEVLRNIHRRLIVATGEKILCTTPNTTSSQLLSGHRGTLRHVCYIYVL